MHPGSLDRCSEGPLWVESGHPTGPLVSAPSGRLRPAAAHSSIAHGASRRSRSPATVRLHHSRWTSAGPMRPRNRRPSRSWSPTSATWTWCSPLTRADGAVAVEIQREVRELVRTVGRKAGEAPLCRRSRRLSAHVSRRPPARLQGPHAMKARCYFTARRITSAEGLTRYKLARASVSSIPKARVP